MGCASCVNIKKENNDEMKKENVEIKEVSNSEQVNNIQETLESEIENSNEKRNNGIFEFFIDLRANPGEYIEESKNYKLDDIITIAYNNKLYENKKMLIYNSFYNLFLDVSVKKFFDSKENISSDLENNIQLKDYKKTLFSVKSNSKNPKDYVWYLLKENKNIALNEILYKNYDTFAVSSISFEEQIIVYYLFLKKI